MKLAATTVGTTFGFVENIHVNIYAFVNQGEMAGTAQLLHSPEVRVCKNYLRYLADYNRNIFMRFGSYNFSSTARKKRNSLCFYLQKI